MEYSLIKKKSSTDAKTGLIMKSEPQGVDGEKGAKIFYEPRRPLSAYFNDEITKVIHEIEPSMKVEEIDIWTNSEAALQRGVDQHRVYFNGEPIKEFYMNKEPFKNEIRRVIMEHR